MYLAIDTSTDTASLALARDQKIIAESTWYCGKNHTSQLLPQMMQLLHENNSSVQNLSGIIVAIGPGSFNGLRVGVTTAKGFAFSLDIPLVGINTLSAEAYQHYDTGLPVCPIFKSVRGEVIAAIYQKKQDEWCQLMAEQITTVEALCSQMTKTTIFCGEIIPLIANQLVKELGQKAIISPTTRSATFLAKLGLKRLIRGENDNSENLQPIYARQPPITKPKPKEWRQK